jgi:hypothetical protein
MYGYEYELQRMRNEHLHAQAQTERLLQSDRQSQSVDLRKVLGSQLVKLGTRLQR